MEQFKFYIILSIAIFLSSCSTLKEGFTNQKKNNSDEFLVEKKSPLVMPPNYNELPIPNEENSSKETNDIKSLITKSRNDNKLEAVDSDNDLEQSILDKIKNN